jgi:hypothetical protein
LGAAESAIKGLPAPAQLITSTDEEHQPTQSYLDLPVTAARLYAHEFTRKLVREWSAKDAKATAHFLHLCRGFVTILTALSTENELALVQSILQVSGSLNSLFNTFKAFLDECTKTLESSVSDSKTIPTYQAIISHFLVRNIPFGDIAIIQILLQQLDTCGWCFCDDCYGDITSVPQTCQLFNLTHSSFLQLPIQFPSNSRALIESQS